MTGDGAVDEPWRAFHERVVELISDRSRGDTLRISLAPESADLDANVPYVEFTFAGDDSVVVAVASNRTLDRDWRLTRRGQATLRRWGLACPTTQDPTYRETYDRRLPDEPARIAVSALRDVFGVVDPEPLVSPDAHLTPRASASWDEDPSLADGARPSSRAEIDRLVEIALRPMLGDVERDEDGDVYVDHGPSVVSVIVCRPDPVIEICCPLGLGFTHPALTAALVAKLNDDIPGVDVRQFSEDGALLVIQMPSTPFVPEHLRAHVKRLMELIDLWYQQILPRIMATGRDPEPGGTQER